MSAYKRRRKERIRQIFEGNADAAWREWKQPAPGGRRFNKWAVCVLLYAAVFAAFRLDHPMADKAEHFVRTALTESVDFRKAQDWYRRHIGSLPSFLPAFGQKEQGGDLAVPASGRLGGYTAAGRGVRLETEPGAAALAVADGWVIHAGELPGMGLTVVVRHAEGLETVYGGLASLVVGDRDWLKGGAMIGTVQTGPDGRSGYMYFAVRRHGEYVDPREVITLD